MLENRAAPYVWRADYTPLSQVNIWPKTSASCSTRRDRAVFRGGIHGGRSSSSISPRGVGAWPARMTPRSPRSYAPQRGPDPAGERRDETGLHRRRFHRPRAISPTPLAKGGMRVRAILRATSPSRAPPPARDDLKTNLERSRAGVIALKTRSIPVAEAVPPQSLARSTGCARRAAPVPVQVLLHLRLRRPEGNIGPPSPTRWPRPRSARTMRSHVCPPSFPATGARSTRGTRSSPTAC